MSLRARLERKLNAVWYGGQSPGILLKSLESLFTVVSRRRRHQFLSGQREVCRVGCPVVVIGNLTAGGSGKTPFVVFLCEWLMAQGLGWRPGVISRGYGSTAGKGPVVVSRSSSPEQVGDEALLVHLRTGLPVVVGSDRVQAAKKLIDEFKVNIVISDDGLQHYRLARDLEIVLIDGKREFGNGRLLPAGPLRESVDRLEQVDLQIRLGHGQDAQLQPDELLAVDQSGRRQPVTGLNDGQWSAIAGIANPGRFFGTLRELNASVESETVFPDHHSFDVGELSHLADRQVIMTEKDAVKCQAFAGPDWWYLKVSLHLQEDKLAELALTVNRLGQPE